MLITVFAKAHLFLNQLNVVHAFKFCFSKKGFNIIFQYKFRSFPFRFSNQHFCTHFSSIVDHACYIPRPSNAPLNRPKNAGCLFSYIFNLYSSAKVTDQVSQPYKTAGKFSFLYLIQNFGRETSLKKSTWKTEK
jgi:hypothetical protein